MGTKSYHNTGDTMDTHERKRKLARAIYDLTPGDGIRIVDCKSYNVTHTIAMLWATMQIPYDVDAYDIHETDAGNTFVSLQNDATQIAPRLVCGKYGRYHNGT